MTRSVRVGTPALLVLVVSLTPAFGQTPPPTAGDKTPAFRFTFTERIRQESSDNVVSLNESASDSSAYVRFRTTLMGQWRAAPNLELTVRLSNENRYYLAPKSDPRIGKNYGFHEVFLDSLNAKWRNPAGLPFTLSVGRQDLQLGEGFVVWDGGPLDGSRSAYFNALRLDWPLGEKTVLTGFYAFQPRTDTLLPVLNDMGQKMVEQPEEGFGVYLAGTAKALSFDAYLFRKNIRRSGALPGSRLNILGGRVVVPVAPDLSLTAEAAGQLGSYGDRDRTGLGGQFHLDWKTGARFPLPAQLTLGGIRLSGDDPATDDRYEGWDPAFGRWPKWSESQIYILGRESGPAFWTNYVSLYASAAVVFAESARLLLTWHHLRAVESGLPSSFLSGTGRGRGELGIARLNFDVSRNLQGHFVWEHFRPGDYYFAGAQSYAWIRFELMFRY